SDASARLGPDRQTLSGERSVAPVPDGRRPEERTRRSETAARVGRARAWVAPVGEQRASYVQTNRVAAGRKLRRRSSARPLGPSVAQYPGDDRTDAGESCADCWLRRD